MKVAVLKKKCMKLEFCIVLLKGRGFVASFAIMHVLQNILGAMKVFKNAGGDCQLYFL